jgi:serine O-acetyltransferase
MFARITVFLDSIIERDPAARSRLEVALLYPGVRALVFHRAAHALWRSGFHFIGRLVSELGKWLSGIEIHPAAQIGRNLFIDHGAGVVIGQTAVIGHNVTLYHGVTLGGIGGGVRTSQRRHPKIDDDVVIGAGAQVLGPITVHRHARIGANAVVLKDVAETTTVVGIPAQAVDDNSSARLESFAPYGAPSEELPDPTAKAICALTAEVNALRRRLDGLDALAGFAHDRAGAAHAPPNARMAASGPEG